MLMMPAMGLLIPPLHCCGAMPPPLQRTQLSSQRRINALLGISMAVGTLTQDTEDGRRLARLRAHLWERYGENEGSKRPNAPQQTRTDVREPMSESRCPRTDVRGARSDRGAAHFSLSGRPSPAADLTSECDTSDGWLLRTDAVSRRPGARPARWCVD